MQYIIHFLSYLLLETKKMLKSLKNIYSLRLVTTKYKAKGCVTLYRCLTSCLIQGILRIFCYIVGNTGTVTGQCYRYCESDCKVFIGTHSSDFKILTRNSPLKKNLYSGGLVSRTVLRLIFMEDQTQSDI